MLFVGKGNPLGESIQTSEIDANAVTEAKLGFSDNTTADASSTKHGLCPKLSNNASQYLDGTGVFSIPSAGMTRVAGDRLTVAAASMSFTGLSSDTYIIVGYYKLDGDGNGYMRFNNDSAANYTNFDQAGGNFGGVTSAHAIGSTFTNRTASFITVIGKPIAGVVGMAVTQSTNGVSNTMTNGSKWNETSNKITRIDIVASANNLDVGTEVTIYGLSES